MKYFKLTVLTFLIISSNLFGQDKEKINMTPFRLTALEMVSDTIPTPFKYYFNKDDIQTSAEVVPILKYLESIKESQEYFNSRNPNSDFKILFGGKALNLLFAKKLGTGFNTSNDLTLQKSFFNLDAAEKSLSFGYNIDNRYGDPLKQLDWVFSIGAKIIASNNFSTIATGGDLEENNIGLNLKFSFVNNGRIGWSIAKKNEGDYLTQRQNIETNREFLFNIYNEKINFFNKNNLPALVERNKKIHGDSGAKVEIEKVIKKKSEQLLFEMIDEELKYIESNNLYTTIYNSWFTFEAYIPFGDKDYNVTPIKLDNKASHAQYYPFNTNLSFNWYKQKPNGFSYFGKLTSVIKGNSSIDVDGLTAKQFQSITTSNGNSALTESISAIDVKDNYKRFITPSFKAEAAFFCYNNSIGFSPSIEKNFGEYDAINWKLGIPVSLKDKEGKPTVNFELQWRETRTLTKSQHLIGFSTSFFFGDLMK